MSTETIAVFFFSYIAFAYVGGQMCANTCVWRSKDDFQELVPSDQTQGLRLAGKYVIQLSYLYHSQNYFPKKI